MPRLPQPQLRYQKEQIAVKTEDLAALYDNQRQLRVGYKKLLEWALHEVESNNFQVCSDGVACQLPTAFTSRLKAKLGFCGRV